MKKTTTYKCFRNIVVFDLTHVGERDRDRERETGEGDTWRKKGGRLKKREIERVGDIEGEEER